MTSVIGEDRSSFQAVVPWTGDSFGFCKAAEGTSWKDPTFAANWANLRAEGKPRGTYHFFHPADDPVTQARFFYSVVSAQGIIPGDIFIADVEITVGSDSLEFYGTARAATRAHEGLRAHPVTVPVGTGALQFLEELSSLAGPSHRVLLYTNAYMAQRELQGCAAYPLFLAYYAPAPAVPAPWRNWTFWQDGALSPAGGDTDYFNGSPAQLEAWAGISNWTEALVDNLPTLAVGAKDSGTNPAAWWVRKAQEFTAAYGRRHGMPASVTGLADDGDYGPKTKAAVVLVQAKAGLAQDGVTGRDTWTALITG